MGQAKTKQWNEMTMIVSGASRGLGMAICRHFGALGLKIAAIARNTDALKALVEQRQAADGELLVYEGDVTDYARMGQIADEVASRWGKIDLLVNNAGLVHGTPLEAMGQEEIDEMIDVNLKGLIYLTRHVAPYMIKEKDGHIINISSVTGNRGLSSNGVYAASKHGVNGFSDSISKYLADFNVKVATLCPGGINTSWWERNEYNRAREQLLEPDDIAGLIEHIVSLPSTVLMKNMTFFPLCEADQW